MVVDLLILTLDRHQGLPSTCKPEMEMEFELMYAVGRIYEIR